VIYAAIVVAWAAYLVPLALRRHDEAARSRSIERFSSAMRVLARRGSSYRGRTIVTPQRNSERLLPPSRGLGAAPAVEPAVRVPAPRPDRAAMRAAAARRRRVLSVLLGLSALAGIAAVAGVLPVWSSLVPLVLVVLFLVVARRQVRRASEDYWVEASAVETPSNVVRRSAARVEASHGAAKRAVDDTMRSTRGRGVEPEGERDASDDEPTVTLTAEQMAAAAHLDEERVLAVSVTTADGESLWDPLPVTLPTYVDKPVARRSVRTIDLGSEGVYSAGHDEADSQTVSETPSAPEEPAEDVETPKVVNG
jgi:hypothetical protein